MEAGYTLEKRLREAIKEEELISAVYLFGSYARGLQTKFSDIDVAVLLSCTPRNMLEYYLYLTDKLAEALELDIDLVILNIAPPLLKYQVLKHGRLIYSRNERERVLFEARSLCEYLDFKRVMEEYDKWLVKRILK